MKISAFFTPAEAREEDLKGKIAVVIDVLRASTTIVVAISNGAKQIIPIGSVEKAYELRETLRELRPLLCGERDGQKLPNFDLGNSPFEYTESVVSGKTLIYASTNGSQAIIRAGAHASSVYIVGFVNLPFAVSFLTEKLQDIALICAGRLGGFSLEDATCAGMLIKSFLSDKRYEMTGDQAKVAVMLYERFSRNISEALMTSVHGRYLASLGFEADVRFCAEVGIYKVIPRLEGKIIV